MTVYVDTSAEREVRVLAEDFSVGALPGATDDAHEQDVARLLVEFGETMHEVLGEPYDWDR